MTKDELLALLEHGCKTEEAILLYSKHIQNTLYLSGFNEHLRSRTRELLHILQRESHEHEIFMKQLIEQVRRGEKNVY